MERGKVSASQNWKNIEYRFGMSPAKVSCTNSFTGTKKLAFGREDNVIKGVNQHLLEIQHIVVIGQRTHQR